MLGTAGQRKRPGHILISSVEHAAVRACANRLAGQGHTVETLDVNQDGQVDPDLVSSRVQADTFLVGIVHISNETGALQPVAKIAAAVKRKNPKTRVFVDAVQSFGKLHVTLSDLKADLLSLSAHKIHGPKGHGRPRHRRHRQSRTTLVWWRSGTWLAPGNRERPRHRRSWRSHRPVRPSIPRSFAPIATSYKPPCKPHSRARGPWLQSNAGVLTWLSFPCQTGNPTWSSIRSLTAAFVPPAGPPATPTQAPEVPFLTPCGSPKATAFFVSRSAG